MDTSRQQVVEAAVELFTRFGREGVRPRQLVRRRAFAPEAVFRHFKNRDELFAAVLAQVQAELFAYLEAACPVEPGETALVSLLRLAEAYCRFLEERSPAYGEVLSSAIRGALAGESGREQARFLARIVSQFELLLRLGRLDGSLRETSPETAERIVSVLVGTVRLSLTPPSVRAANLRVMLTALVGVQPARVRAA